MAGIDHTNAPIAIREKFSFSSRLMSKILSLAVSESGVLGAAMLQTCNRTELYVSYEAGCDFSPAGFLADQAGYSESPYAFSKREGIEAARHLFETACGMKSMIFGEKQILAQTKAAIAFARECGTADAALESLFNKAIDSAKKIATNVRFARDSASAASMAIAAASKHLSINGAKVLVIGNGEMGKLAAIAFQSNGAEVFMTLRRFKEGLPNIPEGCTAVEYEKRLEFIPVCDVVVSATLSPHYTITAGDINTSDPGLGKKVFVDLAVPRDIDEQIAAISGAALYDIDSMGGSSAACDPNEIMAAEAIISDALSDFAHWYYFRPYLPIVNEISSRAADDAKLRASAKIKKAIGTENAVIIEKEVYSAVYKVVGKLMFGFKDNLDPGLWEDCLECMKKTVEA